MLSQGATEVPRLRVSGSYPLKQDDCPGTGGRLEYGVRAVLRLLLEFFDSFRE
jgi:hypothetical protein